MFVVVLWWGGGGGGSNRKTASTQPHNPLLAPLRWLRPGLHFFSVRERSGPYI